LPLVPPTQPVFRSHAVALCCCNLSASIVAYLTGCHTKKGSPSAAGRGGGGWQVEWRWARGSE